MSRSLVELVDWKRALTIMGVAVRYQLLPLALRCPFCVSGKIWAYQDTTVGGQRLHCSSCKAYGDVISLAAKLWKVSVENAAQRLHQEGCVDCDRTMLPALTVHHENTVCRHENFARSLVASVLNGQPLSETPAGIRLASRLKIRIEPRLGWTPTSIPRMAGYAEADAIERELRNLPKTRRRNANMVRRIVPGDWDETLVVPAYDIPGRPVGLHLLTADRLSRMQQVYHPFSYAKASREAGVVCHPAIRQEKTLATGNLSIGLRLLSKGFLKNNRPLPVAIYHDGESYKTQSWNMFAGNDLVFWSIGPSPSVFWHAMRTNSAVSVSGPRSDSRISKYISEVEPNGMLDRLFDTAIAWPDAIAKLVDRISETELREFISQLRASGDEAAVILDACTLKSKKRLRRLIATTPVRQIIPIGTGGVEQRADGWWFIGPKKEEHITSAPFVMEKTTVFKDTSATTVTVRAEHRQKSYRFETLFNKFKERPLDMVAEHILRRGGGVVGYVRDWQRRAVHIATQVYPAEQEVGEYQSGWDSRRDRFCIGSHHVSLGRITKCEVDEQQYETYGHLSPNWRNLRKNLDTIPTVYKSIVGQFVKMLWAQYHQTPVSPVTLFGIGAVHAAQCLAKTWRLSVLPEGSPTQQSQYFELHRLPGFLLGPSLEDDSQRRWRLAVTELAELPVFIRSNAVQKTYQWLHHTPSIECHDNIASLSATQSAALAAWCLSLLKRVHGVKPDQFCSILSISEQIGVGRPSDWSDCVQQPPDAGTAMLQLIQLSAEAGNLSIKDTDRIPRDVMCLARLKQSGELFMPTRTLEMVRKRHNLPGLFTDRLKLDMLSSPVVKGLSHMGGKAGWVFRSEAVRNILEPTSLRND